MKSQIFYRQASVSAGEAIKELLARHTNATLEEFETRVATADEAKSNNLTPGTRVFAATLKFAEDLPVESESESEPPAEKSEPKESPEPAFGGGEEEGAGESEDSVDDAPPKPKSEGDSEDAGPDGKPKKLAPEEEMVHLLHEILQALKGGSDPMGKPGLGDDLGAPAPPPPHGAPAGPPPGPPGLGGPAGPPGHGGPSLPPPVEKSPGMAFAHYDSSASSFSVIRRQANELGVRGLKAEAESVYPTHRVARLVTTGFAEIDGYQVDLAQNNIAVITLTAK